MKHKNIIVSGQVFFISEDGYIVTNNHVIEGSIRLTVVLEDGTDVPAELIGKDDITDLAVLKVTSNRKFRPVEFESEDNIRVGETRFSIGSPKGLHGTVNAGIISAFKRPDFIRNINGDSFIQIDAPVTFGSSGGPCLNVRGHLVGVVIGGNPDGYYPFIIHPSVVQQVVPHFFKKGRVDRGWAGFFVQDLTQELAVPLGLKDVNGVIVTYVVKDSPSDKMGLKKGDVICAVNGNVINDSQDFIHSMRSYLPKDKVELSLCKKGEKSSISLVLENGFVYAANLDLKMLQGTKKFLGLTLKDMMYEDKKVVRIFDLIPNSEAEKKGIRIGMYINSVNGKLVYSADDVENIIEESKAKNNSSIVLLVQTDPDIDNPLYNRTVDSDRLVSLRLTY